MTTIEIINHTQSIFHNTVRELDKVLIGQENVKKAIAASLLCSTNSKILLTGNTGLGKTTVTKFLASSFDSERISVTSDMIPYDIQSQLKNKQKMSFLQIDEFNRASGKVQSAFIELLEEKQMSIGGQKYEFGDFYVFATQNSADIAGIFNVPQAVYDRFDVNIYFDDLSDEEKQVLLFSGFIPAKTSSLNVSNLAFTAKVVDAFKLGDGDQNILMSAFKIIDQMCINDSKIFAGSNIRAHKFATRLAKIIALANGRDYLLPSDFAGFIKYLYLHRIDQNVARINDQNLEKKFKLAEDQILAIRRKR